MKTWVFSSCRLWVKRIVEQQIVRCTAAVPLPHPQDNNNGPVRVIDWQNSQTFFFFHFACFYVEIQLSISHQCNSWKKVIKSNIFTLGFCHLSEKFFIILQRCPCSIKFCYSTALLRILHLLCYPPNDFSKYWLDLTINDEALIQACICCSLKLYSLIKRCKVNFQTALISIY